MRAEIKFNLLLATLLVCILGLAVQAYYLWHLDRRYVAMAGPQATAVHDEELTPIEQKILDSLDKPATPAFPSIDPFALGGAATIDPFMSMQSMRQRMDALFESAFGGTSLGTGSGWFRSPGIMNQGSATSFTISTPDIQFTETDREYQVHLAIPESHEVELNTELDGSTLSVSGKIQLQLSQNNGGSSSTVVSSSQFSRQFPLSHEVDEFAIATEQTPTGLMVRVPKKAS